MDVRLVWGVAHQTDKKALVPEWVEVYSGVCTDHKSKTQKP